MLVSYTSVRRFDSHDGDCLLLFADCKFKKYLYVMKSTVVRNPLWLGGSSKYVLVYTLHSLEKNNSLTQYTQFFQVTANNIHDSRTQNILSTVMLKNDKLSDRNVRLHLATAEICQARNLSSNLV